MSDLLFRSFVASSLLAQNAQLAGLHTQLGQVNAQTAQLREGVDQVVAELAAARARAAVVDFWRDRIFQVRKSLEALRDDEGQHAGVGYYLTRSLLCYLREAGLSSSSFPEIRDKQYWHETMQLRDLKELRCAAWLGVDERNQWDAALEAVQLRDELRAYVCFWEAKTELRPFLRARDRINRLLNPLEKVAAVGGGLAVLAGLLLIPAFGFLWLYLVIGSVRAIVGGNPTPAAFGVLLICVAPIALYIRFRGRGAGPSSGSFFNRFRPPFPVRVHEIMAPSGWKIGYNITEAELESRMLEFRTNLQARGLTHRLNLPNLKLRLADFEARIQWLRDRGLALP